MNIAQEKGRKAGFAQLNVGANPYRAPVDRKAWLDGWMAGNDQRRIVRKHEHKLYAKADPARFEMLWY